MIATLNIELAGTASPDPLTRIVVVCQRRRCDVVSLTYDRYHQPDRGRVTLIVDVEPRKLEGLRSWLGNLIDVVEVAALVPDLTGGGVSGSGR